MADNDAHNDARDKLGEALTGLGLGSGLWVASDGSYAANIDHLATLQVEPVPNANPGGPVNSYLIVGYTSTGVRVHVIDGIDTRAHAEAALLRLCKIANGR